MTHFIVCTGYRCAASLWYPLHH